MMELNLNIETVYDLIIILWLKLWLQFSAQAASKLETSKVLLLQGLMRDINAKSRENALAPKKVQLINMHS